MDGRRWLAYDPPVTVGPQRPPADALTVQRIRALLVWLSPRARLPDALLERVPGLVGAAERAIRDADHHYVFPGPLWLPARLTSSPCPCPSHREHRFCEHRAAVALLELWRREHERALFELPCWQLELDYLLREDDAPLAAHATAAEDRACRFWASLLPTGGYVHGFDVELRLLRANKRGDGWLKPAKLPRGREALLAKCKPSAALLRVFELGESLAELRKLDGFARRAPKLRARLAHDLIAAFAEAQAAGELDLEYEGLPITASTQTWQPSMQVGPGDAGELEARWTEGLLDHWKLDPAIALTAAGVLAPVAAGVPVHILDRVGDPPVVLAAGAFDTLARTVLARAPIPVEVIEPERVGATAIARREPRVYLEERGAILRVRGKLAYELADGRSLEIDALDGAPLSLGDGLTLVRDRPWERARWRELERHVRLDPTGVELVGDEAWTFLIDGLAALRDHAWVVFGEPGLTANRVLAETLTPSVRIGPSTDWFELEVDFRAEGQTASAAGVIESWLNGDRFIRLADDRVAALPARWLERHGPNLAELVALGRGREPGDARLGTHALPLASDLLDETVSDDPEQHARAAHWRGRARALRRFDGVEDRPVPPGLRAQLRPYQQRGFAWLCFLRDQGFGGCLADDMGLGKTVQALALLLDTHADRGGAPSLVVCPTSVLHTWREQTERFAPALRLHLHHGPRRGSLPADGDVDVVVTSYALLRHDADLWTSRRFRHLVLDEAQAIKNPDSLVSRVARDVRAAHPIALTGTPIENHVVELWSLFELLMPGFFGPRRRFRKRWADPIHKREDATVLARLRQRLRPFLLRRLKREVARELPPKQTQVLRCRLDDEQRRLYERVRETFRGSVLGAVDRQGVGAATLHILEALTRLRQACCHPALLPFPEAKAIARAGRSAKIDLLMVLLREAIGGGHRSLVFSQWPSFLDHVATALDTAGIAYLRLDGSTRDRPGVLARWSAPAGPPVFLISTKAGGVGLDLTEADHVFHLDPWWNPATEDQATDRAHRIGQDRPVMVYKLVAADTVEDKILELQARKRQVFEATVDADRLKVDALSRADLEAVFAPAEPAPEADADVIELFPRA